MHSEKKSLKKVLPYMLDKHAKSRIIKRLIAELTILAEKRKFEPLSSSKRLLKWAGTLIDFWIKPRMVRNVNENEDMII